MKKLMSLMNTLTFYSIVMKVFIVFNIDNLFLRTFVFISIGIIIMSLKVRFDEEVKRIQGTGETIEDIKLLRVTFIRYMVFGIILILFGVYCPQGKIDGLQKILLGSAIILATIGLTTRILKKR